VCPYLFSQDILSSSSICSPCCSPPRRMNKDQWDEKTFHQLPQSHSSDQVPGIAIYP
jgi:hypothetical protein